jgi:predicted nucleic acid-binding Zn ribbon protein
MSQRLKRQFMVGNAIQRVLGRQMHRIAIGSLADLRRAYVAELAEHGAEIEAEAEAAVASGRSTMRNVFAAGMRKHRACEECGGPIEGAQRASRWFCSVRCRQRAHRTRQRAAP